MQSNHSGGDLSISHQEADKPAHQVQRHIYYMHTNRQKMFLDSLVICIKGGKMRKNEN